MKTLSNNSLWRKDSEKNKNSSYFQEHYQENQEKEKQGKFGAIRQNLYSYNDP